MKDIAVVRMVWIASVWLGLMMYGLNVSAQVLAEENTTDDVALSDEQKRYEERVLEIIASLQPKTGIVDLPNGSAQLNVPDSFYYLSPEDADKVLTEIWGNPKSDTLTLGMLFPASVQPYEPEAWGVTIEYVSEGYVDDSDAQSLDYAQMLSDMQEQAEAANSHRVELGYEPIQLVGWAKEPHYDSVNKKLYWAKELKFGDMEENTLNYNIRVLGRKGYLLMNFIAGMNQLDEVDQNVDTVLAMANFNEGSRYADFDPSVDQVAAYGIGALVAGKVLAKTGMLAAALVLLKKFWVFIAIGAFSLFKAVFSRRKSSE